jgi:hypothetical protein
LNRFSSSLSLSSCVLALNMFFEKMIELGLDDCRSNFLFNIHHISLTNTSNMKYDLPKWIHNMNEQRQSMFSVNQTRSTSFLLTSSSSSPVRTRTMINVIYIFGILFMIIVFLLLLWVNLCSRRCWCWHDTPLINRFNRQWPLKHTLTTNSDISSSKHQRSRHISNNDELSLWKNSLIDLFVFVFLFRNQSPLTKMYKNVYFKTLELICWNFQW